MASKNPLEEHRTLFIATRGSALALAQATHIQSLSQELFPDHTFELKVIRTTGDQLQALQDDQSSKEPLPKGLFTKELEAALLNGKADMAIHSLKDLPTELPPKLCLGAITAREDAREILILKKPVDAAIAHPCALLPSKAVVATNSPRRAAQIKAWDSPVEVVPMRGNVPTRLEKLASQKKLHATVLALAGLNRLGYQLEENGRLTGNDAPEGLYGYVIKPEHLLPCVGQGFLGIEIREQDPFVASLVKALEDTPSATAATAERSFLHAMGGGCQTPYAALASWAQPDRLTLKGRAFHGPSCVEAELEGKADDPLSLGQQLAEALSP